MQWYYAVGGKIAGPIEESQLYALVREGRLKPADLVWNETMGREWQAASTVQGLFSQVVIPGTAPASISIEPTPNRELMAQARECLRGRWGLAIGIVIVYLVVLISCNVVPLLGGIIAFLISGPLELGLFAAFLTMARQGETKLGLLFGGFRQFGNAFLAYVVRGIFVLLWALPAVVLGLLALVCGIMHVSGQKLPVSLPPVAAIGALATLAALAAIPAFVATLAYSMTFFVLADRPGTGPVQAILESYRLMKGRKWKYFCLSLRFLGWILLGVLTCGIGFLWVWPYMLTSTARFYDDVRPPA